MNQTVNKRQGFATRVGAIAATVGSAVGLGNIWRFPYVAGENGGGAFIIVYIVCVLLLGIPVIMSEFIIGRSTHKTMRGALQQLSPRSKVHRFSYVCIVGAIITCSFYSVVCGWVIDYLYHAATGSLLGHSAQEYSEMFSAEVGDPWRCCLWTLLFLVINFFVMLHGVQKGVERVANVMMPLLFIMLIIFCVNSLLLPGSSEGVRFLLQPDFSKLTWKGIVEAMGQAFMSLTLGIAGLVTYSSYFKDNTPLVKDAATIATLDTMVAILAGIVIFPAVFAFGLKPESGPKLIFETLPVIFQQLPGGSIWATMFFILLFFASLTSTISLSEIPIAAFVEDFKISRRRATVLCGVIVIALALLCALSFNVLSDYKLWKMNIFDIFNYVSANVFMLMGGLFTAVYVGWFLNKKIITDQFTNFGTAGNRSQGYIIFCLRFVAPVAVLLIFLYYTGLLNVLFP